MTISEEGTVNPRTKAGQALLAETERMLRVRYAPGASLPTAICAIEVEATASAIQRIEALPYEFGNGEYRAAVLAILRGDFE